VPTLTGYRGEHQSLKRPRHWSHMNLVIKNVDLRTVIQQPSRNFQAAMKRGEN
jgi:hypothetical protein